ncbi:effector-associated constant component EACC1 [Streptomyces zhihengii]
MTIITVRTVGHPAAAEAELRSLAAWLEQDRAVRRHVQGGLGSSLAPVPGQQGDGIDILSLVLSSGLSAASLAAAIAAWRSTRLPVPTLVVQRRDGVRVEISGHSQEEAEKLMRSLLDDGEEDGGSTA